MRLRQSSQVAAILTIAFTGAIPAATVELTADEIGERAERADIEGTAALRHYTLTRHYVMDAPRFNRHSEMTVRVTFRPGAGKTFEILSSQNAEGMQKKVFEKLLEAEKQSGQVPSLNEMRIGPRNYSFTLLGKDEGWISLLRFGHQSEAQEQVSAGRQSLDQLRKLRCGTRGRASVGTDLILGGQAGDRHGVLQGRSRMDDLVESLRSGYQDHRAIATGHRIVRFQGQLHAARSVGPNHGYGPRQRFSE